MATTAETMTAIEAAQAWLREARERLEQAQREVYAAEVAVEEAEGRPDSHVARFARAVLADDGDAIHRLAVEGSAAYRRQYPDHHAAHEAEIARAMQAEG